ncbi:MAG TPA: type II toxin-antitoxin system mRNA interferase toxin, RelE/StbE family [Candidatus Saccharimonadales bacterium]
MKRIEFTKQFQKRLKQRYGHQPKIIERLQRHLELFKRGIRKEPINDHPLTGKLKGLRAFSVGGDVRVVYQETEDCYLLLDIGSHNQVY